MDTAEPSTLPMVTVGVISHNGSRVIGDCVRSIANQADVRMRVLLIDVASSDGTADAARAQLPDIEVVRCAVNHGPNPARNLAIEHAQTEHVLLVDDDAVLEPGCVAELLRASAAHPDGGAWLPRVVYHEDPQRILTEGTLLHFVSEAILANRDRPVTEGFTRPVRVTAGMGICMLVSKAAWRHVGGFDEDYFFGRTDGEFTTRLTLAGFRVYAVPAARCAHREKPRGFGRLFYQVRNRWYFTLSLYSGRSLLVLGPALVVHELATALFLAARGQLGTYARGTWHALRDLPRILRKRRAIQRLRRVPDREVLTCGPMMVRSDIAGAAAVAAKRLLESFYAVYWAAFSRFL